VRLSIDLVARYLGFGVGAVALTGRSTVALTSLVIDCRITLLACMVFAELPS
jgi:hypothetical protein